MEGVCIVTDEMDPEADLIRCLSGLIEYLFPGCEYRFNKDYFPFTNPSFEAEVMFNGKWLEILGCGVVQPAILEHCGLAGTKAWAFGLGLERLAMILFAIPDIRLFWTDDDRFHKQFTSEVDISTIKFKPYPTLPNITKDISFWLPETYVENDFFERSREKFGDWVEEVDYSR